VLKDRFQEIFEFTKSESPYRKANKGWINQDIFLDLSPSADSLKKKDEAAKVTLFWSPINNLLSNIFTILIISSILVFTSLSIAKGRFNFNIFNTSLVKEIVQFDDDKFVETSDLNSLDTLNSEFEKNLDINVLDTPNEINVLDDNQIDSEQKTIINKIDKQDIIVKDDESNKDLKILKNKKSQSNFI
tara:strand:- start:154 stop:717 length:564 start_codon:yes stop_codon:yes gene_type:complete